MSTFGKTLPDPRVRPDFVEGPAYQLQPEDLELTSGQCPFCGASKPLLTTRPLPLELQGGARRRSPSFEEVQQYRRYILPEANNHGCSRCELLQLINRLLPPRDTLPAVDSPERELARQLQAIMNPPKPDPVESPVEGQLFDPGKVYTTPNVLMVMLSAFRPELPNMFTDLARPFAQEFMRKHVLGDFGLIGNVSAADAEQGKRWPLCSQLDANADAIEVKRGTVLSHYRVQRFEMRPPSHGGPGPLSPQPCGYAQISIRTELGGPYPVTLVCKDDELNQ